MHRSAAALRSLPLCGGTGRAVESTGDEVDGVGVGVGCCVWGVGVVFCDDVPVMKSAAATAAEAKTKTEAEAAETRSYPVRIYAIRGVSRSGRPGPPAPRVTVPLVELPPAPANIGVDYTERAIVLTWIAPVNTLGTPPIAFNVYSKEPTAPLNPAPLSTPRFETGPVRFGVEQCFVVRSAQVVQNVRIESDPSGEACVTPRDTFPPAPPKGLTAIAGPDGISLSWTASTEPDLAGYIVMRGEESDTALQRLTPDPIRDTNYRDTAVSPGVTYVYRVVAVDTATPPNASPQSDPERATAR